MINNRRLSMQRGFTLIEITFAVLILSASMATLLGLQFATLRREYRDQNLIRAMLVARRVLARLEIEELPIDPQNKQMTVPDMLEQYAPEDFDKSGTEISNQSFADMNVDFVVENWTLPDSEQENDMRKLYMRIYWGPTEIDSFETTYFVPGETSRNNTGANDEDG